MKYEITIESLPEVVYLAVKGYMSWREIAPSELGEWESKYGFPDEGLIDQLKKESGANSVNRLFCNSCILDEQFDWVCGDDIVCENINNRQAGDGFEIIRLASSEYVKIVYTYGDAMSGDDAAKEADDYFWDEWLANNPYTSKIAGDFANMPETADISLHDNENKVVIAWHPIERSE